MVNTSIITYWDNKKISCSIGYGRIIESENKKEGDGKTPLGIHKILYGYYRPDRIEVPKSNLKMYPLQKNWGWCDDPNHLSYNRLVELPFEASHELLWRDDALYDVILVTDYNMNPPIPGKGSAIFIHLSGSATDGDNIDSSAGCLKIHFPDMMNILSTCSCDLYWKVC